MNKIFLGPIFLSSLLFSVQSVEETQQQIADTKARIEALQKSLKELESSLPQAVKNAEIQKAEKYAIKTHAEMGYVQNSGNTDAESFTLDATVKKNWDEHSLALSVDAQYASESGVDTKNKYLTELDYNYRINDRVFFSYLTGYRYDEFSDYDYNVYTGPGLKYITIDTPKHNLVLDGNILHTHDKLNNPDTTEDYMSFRAKGLYSWQILDNLKFEETLTYRTRVDDTDNFFLFSKTAFISKINSMFSVSLSYKIDYVNQTAEGTLHTDKTTAVNLIADF
jgi:putative salt-induced outer membrane protein